MSKSRSGLFGLLALAGFGGIAAALSSKVTMADVKAPTKREWRLAYKGGDPSESDVSALVANAPTYKVGQKVKFQAPAGEDVDISNDPLYGKTLIIRSVLCLAPVMQNAAGKWEREVLASGKLRAAQWSYETDVGGVDRPLNQAWLAAADPSPALVKQVASVISPATTAAATAGKEKPLDLPNYPQGLVVSKGAASGRILAISKAADGFHYKLTAGMGPISSEYQTTQDQLRDMLAKQAGQQSYGFAFPVGVSLKAGKYSTVIADRKDVGGKKHYTVTEGEVSEPALILKLYQGLKA